MSLLNSIRQSQPNCRADQSIYAEFAARAFGLSYRDLDGGTGLAFSVGSARRTIYFGGGRCSFYPQNHATAATLANDKYLANVVLGDAGVPTLGGQYFFLHQRYRAHRPPGHERADALGYLQHLGGRSFAKPLNGSRGDFAQIVEGEVALLGYLDEVARYYDAVLLQPVVSGDEHRVFVLGDAVLYAARKHPPALRGDGVRSLRQLLQAREQALQPHGISAALPDDAALDAILRDGEVWPIPGRMNRSAGGRMVLEAPAPEQAAIALSAVRALGLRVGAVDLFVNIGAVPGAIRVIEVNANPSIRSLEDCDRADLILRIWRDTFTTMGLLNV
ncbi:MAG TPA: hypothetical protein VGC77_10855 [Rhodopseudomonas sp.]|uniref:ATP-grasp domain-containing protein n=1 Tax=Rhodopseudomonas sp. TaxID=1078 RepID=UPI002ED8F373